MSKYTADIKINACKDYLSGKYSHREVCEKYGIRYNSENRHSVIEAWIRYFRKYGHSAFQKKRKKKSYSSAFKEMVVKEYLSGEGSLLDLCVKYNISGSAQLSKWVLLYNANKELKDYYPEREVYMAETRRKTTLEERMEIVEYCLVHCRDYKGTASLYNVSYSQVYTWVKKYDTLGAEGLIDKRGRHKPDEEVDELERLRRENKRLKRQLEENDMLVQLLKKVKEFEGM